MEPVYDEDGIVVDYNMSNAFEYEEYDALHMIVRATPTIGEVVSRVVQGNSETVGEQVQDNGVEEELYDKDRVTLSIAEEIEARNEATLREMEARVISYLESKTEDTEEQVDDSNEDAEGQDSLDTREPEEEQAIDGSDGASDTMETQTDIQYVEVTYI